MQEITIREIEKNEKATLKTIADIHVRTFQGFFLTFMGKGFLRTMYKSYCQHNDSTLLGAFNQGGELLGFLAYSKDMGGLYKYMIKRKLILFAWYSLGAFFRKPKIFVRLIRAFLKPSESKREEKYIELASIGVAPDKKSQGVGSKLISELKDREKDSDASYITLETDAENNEYANAFYVKNGFRLERTYATKENRKMNEYRYDLEKKG